MDRREIIAVFRGRLEEVIERSGLSRSAFATRIGIDRSTLAQVLSSQDDRLPRAETLAAIAADQQVSVDWLLGLTQEGGLSAAIITQPLEIEPGARSPADERVTRWHAEAAGYKVRYVPASLPDLFKTEEIIRYEYREHAGAVPESRILAATARLANVRHPDSDMEVCSPLQNLLGFARGEGIWAELPAAARARQIEAMIGFADELYPSCRWFLFDGLQRYSVPLTIFGPKRAAIYVGQMYFVLNSTEHIRVLAVHFEDLIRAAVVQPPGVPDLLRGLLAEVEASAPAPTIGGRSA
jgi:transcriptional regulator with XRE-family HTH domain